MRRSYESHVEKVARHRIGGYREYAPSPETAFFADALWLHRADLEVPPGAGHRVLPELAVSVGFDAVRGEDGRPVDGCPLLIGPKLRPQVYTIVPGRELAAVRLKPEWVGPILGIDPLDAEMQVIDLAAVRPDLAMPLRDALWQTASAEEAVAVLARTLLRLRASDCSPAPATIAALDAVRRSEGSMTCEWIADRVGTSPRHLRRQVHDAIGVSPKRYARTLRLIRSMRMADGLPRPVWADVAVAAGYCDQSHLIRECIAATGSTPRALHAERRRQIVAMAELSNPA